MKKTSIHCTELRRSRMIQRLMAIITAIMLASTAYSQSKNIHGIVTHQGRPLQRANVVELDANHRIINQTKTNSKGVFVLSVSNSKNHIRVTYEGMVKYSHKIGSIDNWKIELKKNSTEKQEKTVKSRRETSKLLVGHSHNAIITQITWLEQLSDTTFCMIVPIRVNSAVEEYPVGRRMVVQDYNGRAIAIGVCIEDAFAQEGDPKNQDEPYLFNKISNSSVTSRETSFGVAEHEYFCYPRFLFYITDLENLIDHSKDIACFSVDTSQGDNYWLYYPHRHFAKELQKILNKMLK